MKKFVLSLILLSASLLNAQHYYPMLDSINQWTYTANYVPVSPPRQMESQVCSYGLFDSFSGNIGHVYSTHDTITGGKLYKILYAAPASPCYFGLIREDTAARKIYFKDNLGLNETLIYDFSMHIGDSIALQSNAGSNYFPTGIYRLDSIGHIHTKAGMRRIFNLNCHHCSPAAPSLEWVESVGNRGDAIYSYTGNVPGGALIHCPGYPHQMAQIMTCFSHQNIVYYDTCAYYQALHNGCIYTQDTCDYWNVCSGIHELSSLSNWNIYPNPGVSHVQLQLEVAVRDNFEIRIMDISGKQVLKILPLGNLDAGKTEKELDISGLETGLYLIECRSRQGSAFKKLAVQR